MSQGPRDIRQADPGAFARRHRPEVLEALTRVVDGGWYILGQEVAGFERECCEYFGFTHAVGVGNGTDALCLALRALGIGRDCRVATVSHTAVATAAAIDMADATPLFVDIDPVTYTLDPRRLAEALDGPEAIHAIIVVHLYGQPADLLRIQALAKQAGIPVIEDCAQAHGARIGARFVGGMADAAAFSFYPTKNLGALGDGGMVVACDPGVADRVRLLRQYGWRQRFESEIPGVNSRLDELQAAYLRLRLRHLEAGNRRRAAIAQAYDQGFERTGLILPTPVTGTTHVYHQYVIRHRDRDGLQRRLAERGIATTIHYPTPVHRQPAYRSSALLGPGGLAATECAAAEVLSLPMFPELDDAAVEAVIDAVCDSL